MTGFDPKSRAPLKPLPEGWRRYALLGVFVLAGLGVLSTIGMVYLLGWLLALTR